MPVPAPVLAESQSRGLARWKEFTRVPRRKKYLTHVITEARKKLRLKLQNGHIMCGKHEEGPMPRSDP